MVTKVMMPKFGLSMESGIIGSWLVEEGTAVTKGCGLAEITTDKISNTCESPVDGIVRKILLAEGEELPCGSAIAVIADTAKEDISAECGGNLLAAVEENIAAPVILDTAATAGVSAAAITASGADVKITPRAKKIAEDQRLEYAHITGTGLLGAITIADLKQYGIPKAASQAAPPSAYLPATNISAPREEAPVKVPEKAAAQQHVQAVGVYDKTPCVGEDVIVKMTSMETAIAKAMQNSLQTTAQTTITTEAEITGLVKVYKQLKGKYTNAGVKLSYTSMLIKAVAMALENHPKIRTTMADENHLKINSQIHIGVAIDVPNGLVVPVIRNANMKDLRSISIELLELTEKAKNNQLTGDDMGGATITITNLGMFGITYFTPVLNTPESAILGVGAITEKLMVKDGAFAPGSVMNFSMTHDHRVINGAPAARFLKEVTTSLQDFKWV